MNFDLILHPEYAVYVFLLVLVVFPLALGLFIPTDIQMEQHEHYNSLLRKWQKQKQLRIKKYYFFGAVLRIDIFGIKGRQTLLYFRLKKSKYKLIFTRFKKSNEDEKI